MAVEKVLIEAANVFALTEESEIFCLIKILYQGQELQQITLDS